MDAPSPRIDIAPSKALVDERVSIRLLGFEPDQLITVRSRLRDDLNRQWESHATFQADTHGVVDLSSQKPLSGTYEGVDAMGLFWSMALGSDEKDVSPFIAAEIKTGLSPTVMGFTAEAGGEAVASANLERLFVASDVARVPVRENGLVGTLFQPADSGPHPGIIVLGGSEGGLRENEAALLASHGYAALALAYFASERLPARLVHIPLEYFETAIHWIEAQDTVLGDKLAVAGVSRGGELSLLLGATFPEIKAVVASQSCGIVHGGVGGRPSDLFKSAWAYRGEPLPHVSPALFDTIGFGISCGWKWLTRAAIPISPFYLRALKDESALEKATIPVEKTNGPLLLISGQDDQMWASTMFSEMVINRLARHRHPYPYKHLSYEGAGHFIGFPNRFPYLPTTITQVRVPVLGAIFTLGGKAKENAFAQADSWPQVLRFLEETLKP